MHMHETAMVAGGRTTKVHENHEQAWKKGTKMCETEIALEKRCKPKCQKMPGKKPKRNLVPETKSKKCKPKMIDLCLQKRNVKNKAQYLHY